MQQGRAFQVRLSSERPESVKAAFIFRGNAEPSVIRHFEAYILPKKTVMFFHLYTMTFVVLSCVYVARGMLFGAFFFLLLSGVSFAGKTVFKRKIMNCILTSSARIFENSTEHVFCPDYTAAFFDEYMAILFGDGTEIQIFYPNLDRIAEKDGYIAVFTKESLVFPFYNEFVSSKEKHAWADFVRKKAPRIVFLRVK